MGSIAGGGFCSSSAGLSVLTPREERSNLSFAIVARRGSEKCESSFAPRAVPKAPLRPEDDRREHFRRNLQRNATSLEVLLLSARVPKLPLYRAEHESRDAIIAALEPHIRPQLRGMTWTTWRARFGRCCLDMAQSGVSPEEALAAWRAVCEEWGVFVYSMRVVQDRIAKGAAAPRRAPAPDPDDDGIQPLAEIIAEQRAAGVYTGSIRNPRRLSVEV